MSKFTQSELDSMRDKDSAKPEYRELYENLPFIDAYAKHTDLRIAKDGPELAIGAKRDGQQDWGKHGKMQLDFLIEKGLQPQHFLLDFGCGTGRLACKAVPYLYSGHYVGMDISESAVAHCYQHNYAEKTPLFIRSPDGRLPSLQKWQFNLIWSHSVVTHLPPEHLSLLLEDLSQMTFDAWYFTYKQSKANQRTGLKQFSYSPEWMGEEAKKYGLEATTDPMEWPAGQKTMRVTRG